MVMEYFAFLVIFIIGFLTKLADMAVDDGLNIPKHVSYVTGAVYGILIAYVITSYPILSPLGLAVVLAVLLMRKIDAAPHDIGIAMMLLTLALLGFPKTDSMLLLLFLVAGISDEVLSDFADKGKVKGLAGEILKKRIILEIVCLSFSALTGKWMVFLGIFFYDAGYILTGKVGERFI